MTAIRLCVLALVTGTLALAATAAPAVAYQQIQLENTMISNYSVSGSAANDLPGPPPMAAQTPGPIPAMPKLCECAVKGKIIDVEARTAPRLSAARRR